jgi:LacI family transcriptional regulator
MIRQTGKSRLEDIARHAGVGIATVDRVLNERGGVSDKTAARVLESARTLGTNRILPAGSRRRLCVEAVLSRRHSAYYERLNQALMTVGKLFDVPVTIYRTHIDVTEPARVARHLEAVADSRDGIILFANDVPQIARAIKPLTKKTVVVTISTDVPDSGRHCYVGIDNFNAGLSAAKISEAMCRKGGQVLVIEPERMAQAQIQRFNGIKHFFENRDEAQKLSFFTNDRTSTLALAELLKFLKTETDIRVLYSPINDAFVERVIEAGKSEEAIGSLAKIVHDLSPHSIENLQSGLIDLVLDSNPLKQVFQALEFIANQHDYTSEMSMSAVDFQLYTSENLPRSEFPS